jgi:MoCo/4Fe-4S cofactor protein with predicted Tat translocation signal
MSHTHDHDHDHEHEAPKASAERPLYWSTLEQYHQTPEYIARRDEEFYPEAKPEKYFDALDRGEENPGVVDSPMQRRTFLKLSGFAAVLAAVAACERPVTKILPYVTSPEDLIPGVQNYYATTCGECAAACGIVSTNRDGRPIKLEGNKAHAVNKGSLCARAQSRPPEPLQSRPCPVADGNRSRHGQGRTDRDGEGGRCDCIEAEDCAGQGRAAHRDDAWPHACPPHGRYEEGLPDVRTCHVRPDFDRPRYGSLSQGVRHHRRPRYMFQNAETVVLLGGDPISQGVSRVEYQRGLAERRKPDDHMSRIYSFEPVPTLSGAYADYRFRVRTDTLLFVALAIAGELGFGAGLPSVTASEAETAADVPSGTIAKIATRLRRDAGKSLVYCESSTLSGREGRALAAVCAWINESLGNIGKTIDITGSPSNQSGGSHSAMMSLIADLKEGRVGALLFHGVNPAYTLPNREEFAGGGEGRSLRCFAEPQARRDDDAGEHPHARVALARNVG